MAVVHEVHREALGEPELHIDPFEQDRPAVGVNQQRELEAVADRHGWAVVDVFRDHAISGKNWREQRPAFDRLLKAWREGTST